MENPDIQASNNQEAFSVKPQSQVLIKVLKFVVIPLLVLTVAASIYFTFFPENKPDLPFLPKPSPGIASPKIGFEKFTSEEEFKIYLEEAAAVAGSGFLGISPRLGRGNIEDLTFEALSPEVGMAQKSAEAPGRVSETTVQIKGIDEPDIVKTDGKEIYFSSKFSYRVTPGRPMPLMEESISMPPPERGETKVIKAFPPADLEKEGKVEKTGDLLLIKDILVVLSDNKIIYGYDVSDPSSPTEKWKLELEDNNHLVSARLYNGEIYFVTRIRINNNKPCPIVPFSSGNSQISINCAEIYHPTTNIPVDVTYSAFVLNPNSGKIDKSVSFIGSSGTSVIFMSKNALYATFSYYGDMTDFLYNFFKEKGQDLLPALLIDKLEKLRDYDISAQAKMVEFESILEQHMSSLSNDERLRMENEFSNRMEDYYQEHMRELEITGIVKIDLDNFKVLATGSVPGLPLNQFSLDEYQDHLRIATTVSGGGFGVGESANDVYVLDGNLNQVGSVLNLGLDERIYSARFIEDKGYLVTFKQIDPFYVLDLSNPKNPQVKGELKIPGYSSYLHPLAKDKILGVGKEGSKVKASLFDVSSASNPKEVGKYILLDEHWSDILNTHHAFLLDPDHLVFFLPGSKGGYIFSYKDDSLSMVKAVADIQARRAIYINDYMYIIGEDKIIVLSEKDWEEVNKLEL